MVKSQTVRSKINLFQVCWVNAMFCGNSRKYKGKKTKMDITRPPIYGYLSEILFWAQGNMSQLLVEKKFYQHTVTYLRIPKPEWKCESQGFMEIVKFGVKQIWWPNSGQSKKLLISNFYTTPPPGTLIRSWHLWVSKLTEHYIIVVNHQSKIFDVRNKTNGPPSDIPILPSPLLLPPPALFPLVLVKK